MNDWQRNFASVFLQLFPTHEKIHKIELCISKNDTLRVCVYGESNTVFWDVLKEHAETPELIEHNIVKMIARLR